MNKKGSVLNIVPLSLFFLLASVIFVTLYLLNFAVINDYAIGSMDNITTQLVNDGYVDSRVGDLANEFNDGYFQTYRYIDYLWFGLYMAFVIDSLIFAYLAKKMNYFAFLAFLFWGMMFILFLVDMFIITTDWIKVEILDALIPNNVQAIPMFTYWLNHAGIFITIHLVACLVVNVLDFDFRSIIQREQREDLALEDSEVL